MEGDGFKLLIFEIFNNISMIIRLYTAYGIIFIIYKMYNDNIE